MILCSNLNSDMICVKNNNKADVSSIDAVGCTGMICRPPARWKNISRQRLPAGRPRQIQTSKRDMLALAKRREREKCEGAAAPLSKSELRLQVRVIRCSFLATLASFQSPMFVFHATRRTNSTKYHSLALTRPTRRLASRFIAASGVSAISSSLSSSDLVPIPAVALSLSLGSRPSIQSRRRKCAR